MKSLSKYSELQRFASLAAIPLLMSAYSGNSQSIYSTRFEDPPFVAGQPLAGQDGWVAPPPLSPDAAVVTSDKPRLGKQTVHVLGGDLLHQDFINEATGGYYDAIGSYRRAVDYDSGGTQVVRVSAEVRIDGPKTANGNNFFSASIAAIGVDVNGDASGIGELAISSDGHAYGYSSQDLVPTFLTSTRVRLGQWHELAIVVNFAARTYSFYVDDRSLGTFAFDPSATSNILRRGSLIAYAAPDTATLKKADYAAHYDQFSIKAIREHDGDEDRDRNDRRER
ncbi:MAG: hypothetical protein NT154_16125 [Verrucomicrobia bacterium]|nr:hypothetical protein [Verrucomicrobiota bacterium]